MIRVAHVATWYHSHTTILAPKLAALAAYDDLEITAISGPRPDESDPRVPPVPHIAVPMVRPIRPWADFGSVRALARLFREGKYDVVHSHTSKAGVVTAIAGWLARVPVVVHTNHGMPFFDSQPALGYHFRRTIEWWACRFRHHAFAQNPDDVPTIARLMGSPDKVTIEGNGVDVGALDVQAGEQREAAEPLYPPGGLRLALVSRLEPVKHVHDAIEACALLSQQGVDVSLVIAGTGHEEERLRALIQARQLQDRVHMVGWVTSVPGMLAASDIVLLSSAKEGIPRALMEAMALRRPVVATDVDGTRTLVVDGQTGYLVPLGDPPALAAKVKALAGDEALRRRFGEAGRERVLAQFNDLRIAALLREFYLQAVDTRARR